ncbi:protein kinase domain-containing protein [Floridanema evergladense]|uniref:non-specific serine/threonine protein kinase n=1 Tax=Floridaenema evergladense BLCC-F167 TaxID=3153639 RepID=A0ABV4WJB4_9CYAN
MNRVLLDIKATRPMLGDLLDDRYQVLQVLSAGAFGRTYIAEDTLLPNFPKRIIRHLKPSENYPHLLLFIRQLFSNETKTLETLGQHDQIPELLAFFEDDQGFYLVQELFVGQLLSNLLTTSQNRSKYWTESQVIQLLQDVLNILDFFHAQGIIHCDIKPNNLIKRSDNGQICLLDFGAVQPISRLKNNTNQTQINFNIQPAGYIPAEQLAYQPQQNSDIYALGMIAIQALTGIHPTQLTIDPDSQEISWQHLAYVSDELANILKKMVCYSYQERYQTAADVLQSLDKLANPETLPITPQELTFYSCPIEDLENVLDFNEKILEGIKASLNQTTDDIIKTINIQQRRFFKFPVLSPLIVVFIISISINSFVIISGFFYISQPDPAQMRQMEQMVQQPLEQITKKVCQIPYLCYWFSK